MKIRRRFGIVKNIFLLTVILTVMLFMMFMYIDYSAQIPFKLVLDVMLIQFVAFRICARRVRVKVNCKNGRIAYNDDNISILMTLNKRSIYPFKCIEYSILYKNKYARTYQRKKIRVELKSQQTQQEGLEIGRLGCGFNEFFIEDIVLYDMFGFAGSRISKRMDSEEKLINLIVLPAVSDVVIDEGELCCLTHEEAEDYFGEISGDNRFENYEIREFKAGDKLNKIHWKLSSKKDELMVYDSLYEFDGGIYVFFDLCEDVDINEMFTEKTSLCAKLLNMGYPVYMTWIEYSTHVGRLIQRRNLITDLSGLETGVIELMSHPLYSSQDKRGIAGLKAIKAA